MLLYKGGCGRWSSRQLVGNMVLQSSHTNTACKNAKKLHNFSENMANIDALFTKSLNFLRFILNFPPPSPQSANLQKYTPMYTS